MKFLTKDYMRLLRLVKFIGQLKVISGIYKKATEEQYKNLYKKSWDNFFESEKENASYFGYCFFDKEYAKQAFIKRIEFCGDLLKLLPENTFNLLEDVELIKIQYCSEKDYAVLKSFYKEELRGLETIAASVREKNETAMWYVKNSVDFDFFTEEIVYDIKSEEKTLTVDFEGCRLTASDITVLERERERICKFNLTDPYCEMTVLHATEVYYNEKEKNFELHLLLDNVDKYDIPHYWNLTVKCGDIKVNAR